MPTCVNTKCPIIKIKDPNAYMCPVCNLATLEFHKEYWEVDKERFSK